MLRMFFFSKGFGDKMVYPLIALFLGTGNQTPNVASGILERLLSVSLNMPNISPLFSKRIMLTSFPSNDPNMKLWDYDPESLLPNLPTMVTFPNLHDFYRDWMEDLISKGVDIRLKTDVTEILQREDQGVLVRTRPFDPDTENRNENHAKPVAERFDELVLCVLADDALKLLGRTATIKEKFVLGGAKFFDDITITHSDSKYFQKHYETKFDPDLCATPKSKTQEDQIAFAKGERPDVGDEAAGYRPMYYTKSYAQDQKKIEMSFDCSNYQHQFRANSPTATAPVPYESHVFQTIFLDKSNEQLWTIDEIDPEKIIERKWWHQLGHRWQHYIRVVPGLFSKIAKLLKGGMNQGES